MLKLLTLIWLFHGSQPPWSILTPTAPHAEFAEPAHPASPFTVKMNVQLAAFAGERVVLDMPGALTVRLRQHNPLDRDRQNYPANAMPDGTVPVLEATLQLRSVDHPKWKSMTIGIPLALLPQPYGKHEVVLDFSGVRWSIYVDGTLLDNDFPYGYPAWRAQNKWSMDPAVVRKAELFVPGLQPVAKSTKRTPQEIQYWTPPGHNSWVGDVATLTYGGRYHVFYLYDRRHHESKFGCGAHYFEHLSTADFKTWTEHEAATPLEEQWECIGTGVPFVFNQKLCLSYGLHTTRVHPKETTALPAQWDYLNKNGRTAAFPRATTKGWPAGSTYAICTDGLARFRKSGVLFHPCENPSVFTDPEGRLRMMANYGSNGIWESDAIDGGWHCINPGFPPGGDCTFFFRWGTFDYIIGGFTKLWSKPADAPISAYQDVVARGLDFYDGSNVPSICEVPGGRFLMAAWIAVRGWGGTLVIRELIQFPDGRIGSKWMKEIMPKTGKEKLIVPPLTEARQVEVPSRSFLLSFLVEPAVPGQGRIGMTLLPAEGQAAATELQIRLAQGSAQWANGFLDRWAAPEKSLREGGGPNAIEQLIGVDQPFEVRVLVKSTDKLGGSLVDAEIAGQRTLISYRPELLTRRLFFRSEGVVLKNVRIAPLHQD